MIIYVDILIFSNTIIDYLLLLLTAAITKKEYKTIRMVIASLIGGISSLYILLQIKTVLIDVLIKLIIGIVLISVAFWPQKYNKILISYIVFLFLSFSLNGLVLFLHNLKPSTFISKNLVSYINISPILLIALTVVFYLVIRLIQKIIQIRLNIDKVAIEILLNSEKIKLNALVDSGHTLIDPLSNSQIIFVDSSIFKSINMEEREYLVRKRTIPVSTVTTSSLLDGIRCDKAVIAVQNNKIVIDKPIIVSSKQDLNDEYNAIISKSAIF